MNISEIYDYLIHARRDLWAALRNQPDEVLSRLLLEGDRFHCINDLVFHTASVEDAWLHYDILGSEPVMKRTAGFEETRGGPVFASAVILSGALLRAELPRSKSGHRHYYGRLARRAR